MSKFDSKYNLDNILGKLHKRQKYLMGRTVVLFFTVLFSYMPILTSNELTITLLLRSTFLLCAPLFLEYFLGMETHNKNSNISRIFGFIFHFSLLIFCFLGLMGGISLTNVEYNSTPSIDICGLIISLNILKIFFWVIPINAFLDCCFCLSTEEAKFYKLQDHLSNEIKEKIEEKNETLISTMEAEERINLLQMVNTPKEEGI